MSVEFRVLVGNRFGNIITEVNPEVSSLVWRLNKIEKANLKFSVKDDKAIERYLRYGNRILISFDNSTGIPNWGGTIETPMVWNNGFVNATVYSIGYQLQFRITAKTRTFVSDFVGKIFRNLLVEAEHEQFMGFTFGHIWTGGRLHTVSYHYKDLWWIFNSSLRKLEGCDFKFTPYESSDGRILFDAEVYEEQGSDKTNTVSLSEGKNVVSVKYEEQGPIINEFTSVGAGTTWGIDRPARTALERNSEQKYGIRQKSRVFSEVTDPNTLFRYSYKQAQREAYSHAMIKMDVIDKAPGLFKDYDVGDVVHCKLPNYSFDGFEGDVRILSRQFNPSSNTCKVVAEVEKLVDEIYYNPGGEEIESH